MIHGFCVDHHLLLGLDPLFAVRGQWRRVYIDLPGMGKSDAGPEIERADAVADAVVSFARKTFANERFAILGNSFGGMIARHVVAEFGDQILGLALLCPAAVADHAQRIVPPPTILQKDPDLLASLDPADAVDYEEMAVLQSPENWVVGFHDQIALSEHYVHSTVAVLDRAGHNVHLDQPEVTRVLLDEWLTRMERRMSND